MNPSPKILFPVPSQRAFTDQFAWAMELSQRINGRLLVLAAEAGTDRFYEELLKAQGTYLQDYHHDERQQGTIRPEPIVATGDLPGALITFLRQEPADILVLDPSIALSQEALQQVSAHSRSMIILPKLVKPEPARTRTDRFMEILRKSRLHRLPENFYSTLGQDRSLFNYLRKLFQKH